MMKTLKKVWALSNKRRKEFVIALTCSFLRSTLAVAQIVAIISALSVMTGVLDPHKGIVACIVSTIVSVVGGFSTSYFEQTNTIKSAMHMSLDMRMDAAAHLRRVPLGFFRKEKSERAIATLTTTLTGIETASSMAMVSIVSGLFNSCAFFLFMCFYSWQAAIIMALGIAAYLLVIRWQIAVSERDAPKRQDAQTSLASRAITFTRGIRVIKQFAPGRGDRGLEEAIDRSRDENIALTRGSMPSQTMGLLTIALFEGAMLFTVCALTLNGAYPITKAIVLLLFSFMAFSSLSQAGSILGMIGLIDSGIAELEEVTGLPILKEKEPEEKSNGVEIKMEDVHFSYGDREVVKGVSCTFRPNTLTAVIGPSGAGKTTLLQLISRFHEMSGGKITIGGADVEHIPYDELMKGISIVFQDTYLFEDTIAGNIRFAKPDATDEEVRAAARAARCSSFIESLPDGYDTMVEEGGNSLSGGERQRIAIARAILKDSPVIILDEATSALDAENEDEFFSAVRNLIDGKTVIMIAHRLSSVERADNIIALCDGKIVEEGTPAELALKDGLYRDFLLARKKAEEWKV